MFEKALHSPPNNCVLLRFALPNRKDLPARDLELSHSLSIALFVARELRVPITGIRFWPSGIEASFEFMSMPETAMHENHLLFGAKYQVRFSGQVLPVQPEAISERMHEAPNFEFRLHVLTLDPPHILRAAFGGQFIHPNLLNRLLADQEKATGGTRGSFDGNLHKARRGLEDESWSLALIDALASNDVPR